MRQCYRGIYVGEVTVRALPRFVVVTDDDDVARSMVKLRLLTDSVELRALLLGEHHDEAEGLEVLCRGS